MTWDVTYAAADGRTCVVQLDAPTISAARTDALPIVGTRGTIIRIDPTPPTIPTTNPATRVIQGDDR